MITLSLFELTVLVCIAVISGIGWIITLCGLKLAIRMLDENVRELWNGDCGAPPHVPSSGTALPPLTASTVQRVLQQEAPPCRH